MLAKAKKRQRHGTPSNGAAKTIGRPSIVDEYRRQSLKNAAKADTHPSPLPSRPYTEYCRLALSAIVASMTNPRQHWDEKGLEELAASIKEKGVLEPVLVRPLAKGRFELVAGERRYRAAKRAGFLDIPARVMELTDLQVLEIQVIENLQRQDLDPLEEARGYQRLVDEHGYTVADLAQKVGKSGASIYGVLKLAQLPENAQQALAGGRIPKTTALLIARVPSEKLREQVTREVLAGDHQGYHHGRKDPDAEPMSFRAAKEHIGLRYMVELKQAPFSRQDATLVPSAGACTTCPKCTGNAPQDYPDARGDICTDPACYAGKVTAHQERVKAEAKASGKKVLSTAECAKLYPYDGKHLRSNEYVDLQAREYVGNKARSWKQMVGAELEKDVVLAQDGEGQLHELVPAAKAKQLARTKYPSMRPAGDNRWKAEEAQRRKDGQRKKEIARVVMGKVAQAAERKFACLVGWDEERQAIMREIAAGVMSGIWRDLAAEICKRRGLSDLRHVTDGPQEVLEKHAKTLSLPACLAFLAEIVAARKLQFASGDFAPGKRFLATLGVDYVAAAAEVGRNRAVEHMRKETAKGNKHLRRSKKAGKS